LPAITLSIVVGPEQICTDSAEPDNNEPSVVPLCFGRSVAVRSLPPVVYAVRLHASADLALRDLAVFSKSMWFTQTVPISI